MRSLLVVVAVGLAVLMPAVAQEAKPLSDLQAGSQPEGATVLKTTTRMVVLDVIATDKQGNPVTDLKAADFTVLEKDQRQQIKAFEFRQPASTPTDQSVIPVTTKLPPNVFTNNQFANEPKTLNVISLDSLNTTMQNQMYLRQQMIRFLDTLPAGQPVALYTLNRELRLAQDFTTDLGVLKEFARNYRPGRSATPDNLARGPKDEILSPGALTNNPLAAGIQEDLERYLFEQSHFDFCTRFTTTIQALQRLAGTLAGHAGRKNIIWASEEFPLRFIPDDGKVHSECPFDTYVMLRTTTNLLADAHIAVYPVDVSGLLVFGIDAVGTGYDQLGRSQVGGTRYGSELQKQYSFNMENHLNMEGIARQTGGRAFYNRNDLDTAIQNSIADGSTYYLLGYYPSNKNWNGEFRNVEVKVSRAGVNLRYRPGYYAIDRQADAKNSNTRDAEVADALDPANPAATSVLFTAVVRDPSTQSGDKMVVDYNVDPHAIAFESGADGLQYADVTCWVKAFNEKGGALKTTSQTTKASLKPDTYQRILKTAFPCTAEMELPAGKYQLRFAVRDERTGLTGTASGKVTITNDRSADAASYPPPEIQLASKDVALPVFPEQKLLPRLETSGPDRPADGLTFCRSLLAGQKYAAGLQAACGYSRSVTRLANYLCEQRTLLSTQVLGDMDPMHNIPAHEIIAQVRVVDGTESYDIKQGAGSNKSTSMFDVSGATGQYSSLLQALFDPRNQPEFSFSKEEVLHSTPALVYKFDVRRENNRTLWFLQSNGVVAYPGYSGQLWIQQKTGQLMRLEMESTDLPSGFPFDSRVSVDYAEVAIGDGSKFVLPVKAHTVMCRTRYPNCNHNRTTFSKFRKFAAEHRIVPSE